MVNSFWFRKSLNFNQNELNEYTSLVELETRPSGCKLVSISKWKLLVNFLLPNVFLWRIYILGICWVFFLVLDCDRPNPQGVEVSLALIYMYHLRNPLRKRELHEDGAVFWRKYCCVLFLLTQLRESMTAPHKGSFHKFWVGTLGLWKKSVSSQWASGTPSGVLARSHTLSFQ